VKKLIFAAVVFCFALTGIPVHAQDAGALLDLLVRKKIISDQEAEEVRAELVKESATTAAGKWKLSTPVNEIELYGDARMRYEYRGGRLPSNDPTHPNDWYERERERYRLRIGLRGTLADDWFFGIRLETSTSPRSTNVTFGDDASVNGPFSKDSDRISVGQAYLGYKGFHDITLTAGRMPNPFVTTLMVWDDDINPEGLAEQWKHTFTFNLGGGGGETVQSYSKEGKGVVAQAAAEPYKLKLDVFANFAQFVYDDTNPENPIGPQPSGVPTTDAFMLGWQVGARLTFPNNVYVQLAPTLYNYTGTGDTFYHHFSGDPGGNQTGVNSLLVFDMPGELGWKIGELPMRIFGDFATNFEGDARAEAAGHPGQGGHRYAYLIGLGVGQLKAKHDWEIRAWWQHTDQYALDPNLVDSDIFDSRVNMEGVAVKAGYALADAIVLNLTWAYGWRSSSLFGTGGVGDIPINPLDEYQIFQADLNVKF
jgi:Putative porin